MPKNGTMAIWGVPKAGSAGTEVEAHFNYWRLSGDKAFRKKQSAKGEVHDFLEVGIMVDDIHQIESICIYVPAVVASKMIEDCAPLLGKAEFAQGIFNEVLAVTTPAAGGPNCVVLLDQNGSVFARVHSFAQGSNSIDASELSTVVQDGGTTLTILPAAMQAACTQANPLAQTYFRVRIKLGRGNQANPFVKVIRPHDRMFQSGYDEIEYIDFRMNEARTLPIAVEQKMRTDRLMGGPIAFKVVAFLTAVPVNSALSVSNTPSHKMRLLEASWNGYVASGIPEGMVVYHWKREKAQGPITDFSAFVKLQTRRSSLKILAIYLAIAFAFGLLGNLSASGIQNELAEWRNSSSGSTDPEIGNHSDPAGRRGQHGVGNTT